MVINIHKFLRHFDAYAKPVTFTYRGNLGYRTAFGGCLSIIFCLFLIALFLSKLTYIGSLTNSNFQKLTFFDDNFPSTA